MLRILIIDIDRKMKKIAILLILTFCYSCTQEDVLLHLPVKIKSEKNTTEYTYDAYGRLIAWNYTGYDGSAAVHRKGSLSYNDTTGDPEMLIFFSDYKRSSEYDRELWYDTCKFQYSSDYSQVLVEKSWVTTDKSNNLKRGSVSYSIMNPPRQYVFCYEHEGYDAPLVLYASFSVDSLKNISRARSGDQGSWFGYDNQQGVFKNVAIAIPKWLMVWLEFHYKAFGSYSFIHNVVKVQKDYDPDHTEMAYTYDKQGYPVEIVPQLVKVDWPANTEISREQQGKLSIQYK